MYYNKISYSFQMFSLTNKDKLPSSGAKQLTIEAERQTDKDREEKC